MDQSPEVHVTRTDLEKLETNHADWSSETSTISSKKRLSKSRRCAAAFVHVFGCCFRGADNIEKADSPVADRQSTKYEEPFRRGFLHPENHGFARTLEVIHSTEKEDFVRCAMAIFDSGSAFNFITLEWLQRSKIPYAPFPEGPRVIAQSFQGAQIVALGQIKGLRFARPRNQVPVTDAGGAVMGLGFKFWDGDFFVLAGPKSAGREVIEMIIGAETIKQHDLYRPCPMLLMGDGQYYPPPSPLTPDGKS